MDYFKPSTQISRIYQTKSKEGTSLRTEDIRGAQPKRFIYDKSTLRDDYNRALQENYKPPRDPDPSKNKLNYWGAFQVSTQASTQASPRGGNLKTEANYEGYTLPTEYQFEPKQVQYDKPYTENYSSPISYQNPTALRQPNARELRNSDSNLVTTLQKMRNPMYSDFDYAGYNKNVVEPQPKYQALPTNQYSNSKPDIQYSKPTNQYSNNRPEIQYSNNRPELQGMDSLEAFKNEYDNLTKKSHTTLPKDAKKFQTDWLNFYGAGQPTANNKSSKHITFQENNVVDPTTEQVAKGEQSPQFKKNMANFFGASATEQDKFSVNVDKFYGYTDEPVKKNTVITKKPSQNIFQVGPKDIVTFNPISAAPVLRYQSIPMRKEKVQVNNVNEQWHYKQNINKFFDG
jgi:hypothetical protein